MGGRLALDEFYAEDNRKSVQKNSKVCQSLCQVKFKLLKILHALLDFILMDALMQETGPVSQNSYGCLTGTDLTLVLYISRLSQPIQLCCM